MATCLFTDTDPKWNDTRRDVLHKILCATNTAAAGGGGGGGAVHAPGAVDPNGVVTATAAGEYYSNTTGGTTWVSTAAGNSSWVQTV